MSMFLKALGNLFRSPATVKYPFEKTYKPDNYRGLIVHNPELCIYCRKCEMACPAGAIVFSQALDGKQSYHYSRHVCIYCGECVRACPKPGAIIQSAEMAAPALKSDNPNNGWNLKFKESMDSRAKYMAEKKKQAQQKADAAQAATDKQE